VAQIIDYDVVAKTLTSAGLVCQYPNSGAFGFDEFQPVMMRGWIGPADASIRPGMRSVIGSVSPPYEENLAALFVRAWRESLSKKLAASKAPIWIMPGSHWAFELDANRAWLMNLLADIDIDAGKLQGRADGSAIEFPDTEALSAGRFVSGLLQNLTASDFFIAFGRNPLVCTVHHHKQLWWSTTERPVLDSLDRLVPCGA
jgi:hypothetical protein